MTIESTFFQEYKSLIIFLKYPPKKVISVGYSLPSSILEILCVKYNQIK